MNTDWRQGFKLVFSFFVSCFLNRVGPALKRSKTFSVFNL